MIKSKEELIASLEVERDAVNYRLERLIQFVESDHFKELDEINQKLLTLQREIMKSYANTLDGRINYNKRK